MPFIRQHEVVTVVAGGWSVSLVDRERLPGHVLAVNDSALHLPYCDSIITMDRLWFENRWAFLQTRAAPTYVRRSAIKIDVDSEECPWLHTFYNDHTSSLMARTPHILNGQNSGTCAAQLALHMATKQIFLVGFDMQRGPNDEAHWYPPYPWNTTASKPPTMEQWSRQFAPLKRYADENGIDVKLVGDRSLITNFDQITYTQLAEFA